METIDNVQGRKFLNIIRQRWDSITFRSSRHLPQAKIIFEMLTEFVLTDPHVVYAVFPLWDMSVLQLK